MFLGTMGFLLALFKRAMEKQILKGVLTGQHGPIGIALFMGMWVQYVIARYRTPIFGLFKKKSVARKIFQYFHSYLGRALFIVVWPCFWYGYLKLNPPGGSAQLKTWGYIQVTVSPSLWFFALLFFKYRLNRRRKGKKPSKVTKPSSIADDGDTANCPKNNIQPPSGGVVKTI